MNSSWAPNMVLSFFSFHKWGYPKILAIAGCFTMDNQKQEWMITRGCTHDFGNLHMRKHSTWPVDSDTKIQWVDQCLDTHIFPPFFGYACRFKQIQSQTCQWILTIWVCLKIVYPYTQWLMIIIPTKWL